MGIFPPPGLCYDLGATRLWLVAVMVGLAVMGLALLVQVRLLWRRMTRIRVAWWQRLPLVLPLVWAGVCAFEFEVAFISYRDMQPQVSLLRCPPGVRCGTPLYCYPDMLGGTAQVALFGTACLLVLGWFASSAFARRIRAV